MNARHFLRMSVVALLLLPASLIAQAIDPGKGLPDLVPVDLAVDKDCRIVVTIQNNGTAIVPDAGYSLRPPDSSGVQMYNNGAPWGGIVLGGLDLSRVSQPVGGRVSYTWFPRLALTPGTHTVSVDVDNNNSIAESNELNNSLTEKLSCQQQPPPQPLPDLVPTNISLQSTSPAVNSPCRIILTLANIGAGNVPDAAYLEIPSAPGVDMYKGGGGWGGAILNIIDRLKVLQPAGATFTTAWMGAPTNLWVPPGDHTLRVVVDENNALVESNEANNSLTKTLTCGIIIAPPTTNP